MSVVIADEILEASQLTQAEFLQEIALHLFQLGRLPLGMAAQVAEMEPQAFRALLKDRQIPLYRYDVEDFETDLQTLGNLGRL